MKSCTLWALALLSTVSTAPALAAEAKDGVPTYEIIIKEHKFQPPELRIAAGVKVKLVVKNQDRTPEEFESHDFNREKIIPGGKQAIIFVGPLKPGSYSFFGEFHPETAQGRLIAE